MVKASRGQGIIIEIIVGASVRIERNEKYNPLGSKERFQRDFHKIINRR